MFVEYLISHWAIVRDGLVETIDKFHEDELDFEPYAGARTVRRIILHIAQEEHGELGYGILQNQMGFPPEYSDKSYRDKATVLALLASVHRETIDYLNTLSEADLSRKIDTPWGASYPLVTLLGHLIEHEIHHRGELSLILGLLGREGLNA
jgi:uncharacterized damage-inducible protein DinB